MFCTFKVKLLKCFPAFLHGFSWKFIIKYVYSPHVSLYRQLNVFIINRYTRLASCDIWGTKEVDFLGLDDFSSPYQDEEVISRTPTLAQLNSEDSLPVCEALYPPADLMLPCSQPLHSQNKRHQGLGVSSVRPSPCSTSSSQSRPSRSLFADFPESSQKATRPVPSSTETMAKTQNQLSLTQDHAQAQPKPPGRGAKVAGPLSHSADFVRKAKVRVSSAPRVQSEATPQTDFERSDPPLPLSQPLDEKPSTSASAALVGHPTSVPGSSAGLEGFERKAEGAARREGPAGRSATAPQLVEANQTVCSMSEALPGAGSDGVLVEDPEQSKEEEHNYSLFLTRNRAQSQLEEDEEEEEEDEEEEPKEDEGDELDLDDEDHDEGFGSEHELSENEEEEEEDEDEDYEADKDDDMSDAFSEPGRDLLPSCFWLALHFSSSFLS